MIEYNGEKLLNSKEAAVMLDRSTDGFRQLVARKRITPRRINGRLFFPVDEINTYFPRRKKLPAFSQLTKDQLAADTFFSFEHVRDVLNYSPGYLHQLIKKKRLTACCTVDGQILVAKSSLDDFLGVSDADDL